LRPWLLGISLNVTRNLNRAARRHQAAMDRIPSPRPVPDFADDLAGQLDDAAELRRVLAALDRLRPGERDVIVLCAWSGLDYAAASQALGVPVGTVRSRLSRARDKLRRTELATGSGQQVGDREPAVRSMREGTR
jgi:RNA polymerase sigma-70 factor (ECF subfamily)